VLQNLKIIKKSNCDDFSVKKRRYPFWLNIKDNKSLLFSAFTFELEPKNDNETHIRDYLALIPPMDFFMFLHFIIAGIFLFFSGIAYSDYVLKTA
jgi:hypothetical protein